MRNILIIMTLIALFNVSQLYTQPGSGGGQGRPDMSKMPAEGVISGKIVDAETGAKMKYTNVIVKSVRDSSIVTGAISDDKGEFSITKVPYGKYFMEFKFIGYQKNVMRDILITPKSKILKIGTIKIKESSAQGQEIDVVADKLYVDYKIDKRVVNVSQDLSSAGMTAVQALENVPSVQVDIDGNVALRGSSNFTVYINGKPSIIQGSEALQQIPSETIDKIEIITNPSAKYDPDGASGIINVILKKEIREGLNGLFNGSYGTWGKYSGDFLLNYFKDKANFYVGGDYRDMNFAGGNKSKTIYQDTVPNTKQLYYDTLNSEGSRDHQRKSYSVKAGMGYEFTDKTSATLEGVFGMGGGGFFMNSKQRYDSVLTNTVYYSKNSSGGLGTRDYWGVNGTFQHKFDDAGHQLDASFQYSDEISDDPNTSFEGKTNSDYSIIDSTYKYETRTHEGELEKEFRLKADYVYPIDDLQKIEAGYSFRMDRTSETYLFEELNNTTSVWDTVDKYTSDMTFSNDIHSIYGTYTGGIAKLGYMIGLRGEYNYRNTQHSDTAYIYDRWDIFPSAHLSYKINDDNQIMASYTKRVNRPHGWDLDPFVTYMDAHNLRKGNAALKPEFTNSYELNYQYSFASASYVSIEGYYRHGTDIIARVQNRLPDGMIMNTFDNINDDYTTGLEGMVNWRPAKWINITGSGTFYNYRLNTVLSKDTIARNTNTWSSRANVILNFGPNTRFQISGDYSAPSVSAQGTTSSMWGMNLAIKQDFLKNMLSVSLNVRDVFATYHRGFTTNTSQIYTENNMWREAPVVMLNLTYRLNNYKKDPKKDSNGNGGSEEPMDNF